MAESQVKPRWPGLLLLLLLFVLVFFMQWRLDSGLRDIELISGWTLLILSLLLATYNLRKKVTSLPIGRAWYWRKAHSFLGWLAVLVFFIHAGAVPPDGWLNLLLWLLFVLLLVNGIAGLWMSLLLPARIGQGGERIQFERLAHLRESQYRRAEQLVLRASARGGGQPLFEFHKRHLTPYLCRFREGIRHCFNRAQSAELLLGELKNIGRYIDAGSSHYVTGLEDVIANKHVLDRQYALQYLLKRWVYAHIALNYMSWVFIVIHVLASYTFRPDYGL